MIDFGFFRSLLFGDKPSFPNLRDLRYEEIVNEGLTMGTLYIGRQGTGKTSSLARHLVDYFKRYPDRAIFVLDWSGSITDTILGMIMHDPDYENLVKRIVYDGMGNPEWVMPLPEFSEEYGNFEDQAQRVSRNLVRLAPELVKNAPLLGGISLNEIAPEIFWLLTAITNDYGETWQITEAKKLIRDVPLLRHALAKYGHKVPNAKWWLEKTYLKIVEKERELRTYALVSMLGAIESREVRARIGYYRPGWTPKEAIEKGLMVLCDGADLINREMSQHYLFMQVYSLIMAEINKRRPANPIDQPVSLVMDEVYSLIQIPGMAPEISKLSPQYRSRKLQLYIVLQELAQMSDELRPHIWSLGNIVSFGISNQEEAAEIAKQLFIYDPKMVKVPPKTDTQLPTTESAHGQYEMIGDWIQRLNHRQCILRRYYSEHQRDNYVRFVQKTRENPTTGNVNDLKDWLLQQRGIRVRDALEVVNQRNIVYEEKGRPGIAP